MAPETDGIHEVMAKNRARHNRKKDKRPLGFLGKAHRKKKFERDFGEGSD